MGRIRWGNDAVGVEQDASCTAHPLDALAERDKGAISMEKYCMFCKHYNGLYCCNPNGYYYGCFRSDYKSCMDFEPKEEGNDEIL